MPMVLGLNQLGNRGCGSVWSHDCQLVYCLVTTHMAYIMVGYWLQPALATTTATLSAHVLTVISIAKLLSVSTSPLH